mgnify:FL=1
MGSGTTIDTPGGIWQIPGGVSPRFIELISSIFLPSLWPLTGAGLLKAFLSLFTNFGLLDTKGTTYAILNASADAIFYFLPMFLAINASRRFKTNQFTSMAVAGALVLPEHRGLRLGHPDRHRGATPGGGPSTW